MFLCIFIYVYQYVVQMPLRNGKSYYNNMFPQKLHTIAKCAHCVHLHADMLLKMSYYQTTNASISLIYDRITIHDIGTQITLWVITSTLHLHCHGHVMTRWDIYLRKTPPKNGNV